MAEISLTLSEQPTRQDMRDWLECLEGRLPSGIIVVQQDTNGQTAILRRHRNTLTVSLARNATEREVQDVVECFSEKFPDCDFSISADSYDIEDTTADVPDDTMQILSSTLAQREHDAWVSGKTKAGWRYGTSLSIENKTHPLLRPWHDLPERFREPSEETPKSLFAALSSAGYAVVRKDDLAALKRILDDVI